jgi:hypothetical protein
MASKTFLHVLSLATSALVLFGAGSAAADEPSAGPVNAGFALQTSLVAAPLALDKDLIGLSTFEGGLFFGYKMDRVVFGVGFDFSNWSEHDTVNDFDPNTMNPVEVSVDRSTYSFVIYPEVQVAFARSADRRAELYGAVSLGLGTWDTTSTRDPDLFPDPNPTTTEPTRIRFRWRAGPGVRYWVHPNIGMSLLAGFSGNYMFLDGDTALESSSVGLTSLYTQIGLLGVF